MVAFNIALKKVPLCIARPLTPERGASTRRLVAEARHTHALPRSCCGAIACLPARHAGNITVTWLPSKFHGHEGLPGVTKP
jgi:hypothetical protein